MHHCGTRQGGSAPALHTCVHDHSKTFFDFTHHVSTEKRSWPTFSSESWHSLVFETKFLRSLHDSDDVGKAEHRWRRDMLHEGLLVNRGKGLELVIGDHSVAVRGSARARRSGGSLEQTDEIHNIAKLLRCAGTRHKTRAPDSSSGARWLLGLQSDYYEIRGGRARHQRGMPRPDHRGVGERNLVPRRRGSSLVSVQGGTNTMIFSLLRCSRTLHIQMIFEWQRCTRRQVLPVRSVTRVPVSSSCSASAKRPRLAMGIPDVDDITEASR